MNSNDFAIRHTVVCLHSSMSHGGQWRALANRLQQEFDVITPNLLGYCGSANGFEQLQLEDEVAAVIAQIPTEANHLHLVGHSFGGAVALRLAIPVRLLCGTHTRPSARQISELLAEILPEVEYYRMPGLAHMAPVTHADDVNPLIVDHILANVADEQIAVA